MKPPPLQKSWLLLSLGFLLPSGDTLTEMLLFFFFCLFPNGMFVSAFCV